MSKTLPSGMQDHLDTGTTTMCHCWRLTRGDATVYGFTEHDKDLTFDGTTFSASSGFTASTFMASMGGAVDNLAAYGALDSAAITEADIALGEFDGATVEVFLVNWADVTERITLLKGGLGEVTRGEYSFEAEMRSLTHMLQQPSGRVYQGRCDAHLGDSRCGATVTTSAGTVTAVTDNRVLTVSGLSNDTLDYYTYGKIVLPGGYEAAIKRHVPGRIDLWIAPPVTISVSDSVTAHTGCDKDAATCKDKFSNLVNFRGFPHIPGDTFVAKYVGSDDADTDGGSRYGN